MFVLRTNHTFVLRINLVVLRITTRGVLSVIFDSLQVSIDPRHARCPNLNPFDPGRFPYFPDVKRPREAGQADPQGGPSKKGGGKSSEHCFDFARSSKCSRGDKCPFSHVCVGCSSTEHGSLLCPKTVP
jgi:hypothetical protein